MIYFDNAATSYPKPESVIHGVNRAMRQYGANPGRSGHTMSMKTAEKIYECRKNVAELFGANEEEVVFTSNCTSALNTAIKGVLSQGDHVIISDLEHNSVLRPVHALAERGVITYSVATVSEGDFNKTLEAFERLIRPETRLIACTHGSNLNGVILPIRQIGALCRKRGILFLVDAAQSAGVIPINMGTHFIDFLCMPGHKGLYGPSGTGVLIAARGDLIRPLMEGGTGSLSLEYSQPNFLPDKLESGTVNTVGIIGLNQGIEFVKSRTMTKIYEHEMSLATVLYEGLSKIHDTILYTRKPQKGLHLPVICFNLTGRTGEEVAGKLNEYGFALRGGYHCAPLAHKKQGTDQIGAARVSFSAFNRMDEVEKLIKTVNNF